MLLAKQLVHHRSVHPGPLVLGTALLKFPTPTTDTRTEEALSFWDTAPAFHLVGDCKTAGTILNATGTAYTAARYLGRYDD